MLRKTRLYRISICAHTKYTPPIGSFTFIHSTKFVIHKAGSFNCYWYKKKLSSNRNFALNSRKEQREENHKWWACTSNCKKKTRQMEYNVYAVIRKRFARYCILFKQKNLYAILLFRCLSTQFSIQFIDQINLHWKF